MNNRQSCTLFLVRHGETAWNQLGLVQGHTDIDLSTAGELQAHARAESFKNIPFASVISSDLSRAMQTALILTKERNMSLNTSSFLREQSWGPWEGKYFTDLKEQFGRKYNAYTGTENHRVPGVESHLQVVQRVEPYLHEAARSFLDQSILVVTHGGVLKGLIYHFGLEEYFDFHFENLGYMRVTSDGNKLTFVEAVGLHNRHGS